MTYRAVITVGSNPSQARSPRTERNIGNSQASSKLKGHNHPQCGQLLHCKSHQIRGWYAEAEALYNQALEVTGRGWV